MNIFKLVSKNKNKNINKQDNNGLNVLMMATYESQLNIIDLLIRNIKINLFLQDNKNNTALSISLNRNMYILLFDNEKKWNKKYNNEDIVEVLRQNEYLFYYNEILNYLEDTFPIDIIRIICIFSLSC